MIADHRNWLPLVATFILSLASLANATATAQVKSFHLSSLDGGKLIVEPVESVEVNDAKLTVLFFSGIECPLAKLYAPRVASLADTYPKSTRFFGISSNQQDSAEEFQQFATDHKIKFPCGKDFNNVVADQFKVKRTPEVIVLDQDFTIRYRGRVDDQYSPGIARNSIKRQDLKIAIDELLAGKPVTEPTTAAEGCLLGRVKQPVEKPTVTYANQISRIFQANCNQCHRDGEIGPFVLDDFEEAVGWGDMIVETIDNGRMPPWHADPNHGSFLNDRRMNETDKELVRKWVKDGTPYGDAADLPDKTIYTTGWRLPQEPDLVVPMRKNPFTIPADGSVDYQYFVVDPKFTEDKWVSAVDVTPGNRSVVHHSIVFIRPPNGELLPDLGWLGAYVPGQTGIEFSKSRARFVPKGSKLVFQQHYTPNGTEQTDLTKIGLVFSNESEVTERLETYMAIDQSFEIKPNDPNHVVNVRLGRIPKNGKLLSISPHMHFRGKSFTAKLTTQGNGDNKGDTSTILSVPAYDFNWQHIYQFREPLPLSDVRSITAAIAFDNSDGNPFNPDPKKYVTWGDQTWEEMAIGFFDVAVPRTPRKKQPEQPAKKTPAQTKADTEKAAKLEARVSKLVEEYFERFDADQDGIIMHAELPLSVRRKVFGRFNTDGKAGLSREDIAEQARRRFERE